MSLLYIDGFAHQNGNRYNSYHALFWQGPSGRTPGGYWASGGYAVGLNFAIKSVTPSSEIFTGIGYQTGSTASSPVQYLTFYTDNGASQQISIMRNASRLIEVRRGSNTTGTIIATGTTVLNDFTWHYIEARVTISAATGIVQVRLDGQTVNEIDFTGNTKAGGTSNNIDNVGIFVPYASSGPYGGISDWYILNTSGTVNNTWLGDVAVRVLLPNGPGTYTQLTNSAGNQTNNYTYVDEAAANNADYTGSQTVGLVDTYSMADLPAGVTNVYGMQVNATMAKSDANLGQAKIRTRVNGVDYAGPTRVLSTTYQEFSELQEINPTTGLPWTVGGMNSVETGMEVA